MSKFNKIKVKAVKVPAPRGTNTPRKAKQSLVTTNLAGGVAYTLKEKTELVTILLTSFVNDQFYRSADDTQKRVAELVSKVADKKFIAKAAIYARNEFGMRSISHVVAGELAKSAAIKGETWTKEFFNQVVRRLDDMMEIVSYTWKDKKTPLPNALKKGFRQAFTRFDGYQLSKYQANNGGIKLVDLVNLVHPVPTARNKDALDALVNGKLKNLTTSQTALTDIGQKETSEADKQALRAGFWKASVTKRSIGYIDLVRSLTKIVNEAPDAIDATVEMLTDKELVKNSKIMPFQLLTAIKMVQANASGIEGRKVVRALNDALNLSCDNVPLFSGKTVVVVDVSGSMNTPVSAKSSLNGMTCREAATLMATLLAKKNDADFMVFADRAGYAKVNTLDSVSTIVDGIQSGRNMPNVGGGTNFHSIWQSLDKKYDRIVILSDMQGWVGGSANTSFGQYVKRTGATPFVYSYDLTGYGTVQLPEEKVFVMAGLSDRAFDVMKLLEQDKEALVKTIEQTVKL